ncbi:MAG: efflux RND transporter permease subunit, partial [Candidatus Omnitrophota bacterium]
MIMTFVVLFGFISLAGLPQELFPPIIYPQLTVVTAYANAAPEEIETLITKPVEEVIGTVSGLKRVKSVSREGISLVMAEFGWNEDMDFNALKVREKIDLVKARLPRESGEPLVMKYNPFERPIMTLSVTGKRSLSGVREVAERYIKDELEKVEGVASAAISGGLEREILIEVDQGRLYAQSVPIMDVVRAITDSNLNYPAGTIKESFYEYLIRTLGEYERVDEIPEIPVKTFDSEEDSPYQEQSGARGRSNPGNLSLIRDVARVNDTFKDPTSYSRYNGKDNISVSIQKSAQANTLQVVNRVNAALKRMRHELPADIRISTVNDQSKFIKDSINGVRDAAIQGGILAFLVLYFFLRNIKSSIIVTFSMPISIMAVFVAMYFCNISLNMMSLGGLALGIGMLVDNAIVVLENITRHRDLGKDSEQAAMDGTNEVANAISASTLTTIAVFFPMVFVVGIAGQLFKQLAFTVIFSLIASLMVALTLIPLLAARVKSARMESMDTASPGQTPGYLVKFENFLRLFLKRRALGYLVLGALFVVMILVFFGIDKELMPRMDQGQFTVRVNMPAGTRLEVTNRIVTKIEDVMIGLHDIKDVSTVVGSSRGKESEDVMQRLGSNQGEISVTLNMKRRIKTKDLVEEIKKKISRMDTEGGKVEYILNESIFSGAVEKSSPIVIEVKGKDMDELGKIVGEIEKGMAGIKGITGIKSDMPERSPETKIMIDKEKAGYFQLSVVDVAQITQVALRGYVASTFKEKGQEIDIKVRLRPEDRDDFGKLARIQLNAPTGISVPLISLVRFVQGRGPSEIKRLDQERTILVSADIFRRPLK